MNREERRRLLKRLKILNRRIKRGDRVVFNMKAITSSSDWEHYTDEYKNFITEHQDTVFTVEFDEKIHDEIPSLVQFAEDESDPKHLFFVGYLRHWYGDK